MDYPECDSLAAPLPLQELGAVSNRSLLWDAVGDGVVILYNASHGHHDQFTSPPCPDGWGGSVRQSFFCASPRA